MFYEVKNGGNSFRNKSRCFMETDGKNGGGITRRFPESATAALISCEDFREEMMKCKDFPGARRL